MSHPRKKKSCINPAISYINRVGISSHTLKNGKSLRFDGKSENDLSENDLMRRNSIKNFCVIGALIELCKPIAEENLAPMSQIKILPFKEKDDWTLVTKYNIGRKK